MMQMFRCMQAVNHERRRPGMDLLHHLLSFESQELTEMPDSFIRKLDS